MATENLVNAFNQIHFTDLLLLDIEIILTSVGSDPIISLGQSLAVQPLGQRCDIPGFLASPTSVGQNHDTPRSHLSAKEQKQVRGCLWWRSTKSWQKWAFKQHPRCGWGLVFVLEQQWCCRQSIWRQVPPRCFLIGPPRPPCTHAHTSPGAEWNPQWVCVVYWK